MYKLLFLIGNFFALSFSDRYVEKYTGYLEQYHKKFSINSFSNFKNNIDLIEEHNSKNYSYRLEMNEFGDMDDFTNEPFKNEDKNYIAINEENIVPMKIDWREKGAVTGVKNQKNCGSCWAFSSTGSIEGLLAIKTSNLLNFSEQQLMDCSSSYGNHGCSGGMMDNAFKYVIDNGICSEESYPYTGMDGSCQQCDTIGQINNYGDIQENDEKILKRAVAQQPVSVAIQANLSSFRFYSSGIYSDPKCGQQLDHGVLIVGYGSDGLYGKDYWLVKNSWGPQWGDNGYIRIERNSNNAGGMCGITLQPSIPLLEDKKNQ